MGTEGDRVGTLRGFIDSVVRKSSISSAEFFARPRRFSLRLSNGGDTL